MFETAKFSYNAIPKVIDSIEGARNNGSPNFKIAVIISQNYYSVPERHVGKYMVEHLLNNEVIQIKIVKYI